MTKLIIELTIDCDPDVAMNAVEHLLDEGVLQDAINDYLDETSGESAKVASASVRFG